MPLKFAHDIDLLFPLNPLYIIIGTSLDLSPANYFYILEPARHESGRRGKPIDLTLNRLKPRFLEKLAPV